MRYIVKFDDAYDVWYKEFDYKDDAIKYAEELQKSHELCREKLWWTLFEIKEVEK